MVFREYTKEIIILNPTQTNHHCSPIIEFLKENQQRQQQPHF